MTRVTAPIPAGSKDRIVFFGFERAGESGTFNQIEIPTSIAQATISMSMRQVTELTLNIEDPGLGILATRALRTGVMQGEDPTSVDWQDHRLKVSAIEVSGGDSGMGRLRVQARSSKIYDLKRRTGPLVMSNARASDFVRDECKAVGAKFVVQESPVRTTVERDVPKPGEAVDPDREPPSSWTTFLRLAREEGYICFEVYQMIYFCKPSFLRDYQTTRRPDVVVNWLRNGGENRSRPIALPRVRRSVDNPVETEVELELPANRAPECAPGRVLNLLGIPMVGRHNRLLITDVSFGMNPETTVRVRAESVKDPFVADIPKDQVQGVVGERGVGQYAHVVEAAKAAGWSGENLVTAVAIALAESGGNAKAVSPPNRNGTRDHGLFQINDIHTFDRSLIYSSRYNAKIAYRIWEQAGRSFRPWSTYWSNPWSSGMGGAGAPYRKWLDEARASIQTQQLPPAGGGTTGGTTSGGGTVSGVPSSTSGSNMPSPLIQNASQRGWGSPGVSPSNLERVDAPWKKWGYGYWAVNKEAAPLYRQLIRDLKAAGAPHLSSSGGYNKRFVAGTTNWSNHAWGLAIDIDAGHNPYSYRYVTDLPSSSGRIANHLGMRWGGNYRVKKDTMHFEVMLSLSQCRALIRKLGLR